MILYLLALSLCLVLLLSQSVWSLLPKSRGIKSGRPLNQSFYIPFHWPHWIVFLAYFIYYSKQGKKFENTCQCGKHQCKCKFVKSQMWLSAFQACLISDKCNCHVMVFLFWSFAINLKRTKTVNRVQTKLDLYKTITSCNPLYPKTL